jgi:hypothetical protein
MPKVSSGPTLLKGYDWFTALGIPANLEPPNLALGAPSAEGNFVETAGRGSP